MVKIGHARISENGTVDGKAGDQTKQEVVITNWYNDRWIAVYRPKNVIHAEKIAKLVEEVCKNDKVGYSQYSRYTLFNQLSNNGYNVSRLTACNCDCSSLVMTACRSVGITVPKAMITATEDNDLMKTGNFTRYITADYLNNSAKLKRGDILLKVGHTAVVLSDGTSIASNTIKATKGAKDFDNKLTGKKVTKYYANMRNGGSIEDKILTFIPINTTLQCYGYYTLDNRGVKWFYCVYVKGNTTYYGFVSEKMVKK